MYEEEWKPAIENLLKCKPQQNQGRFKMALFFLLGLLIVAAVVLVVTTAIAVTTAIVVAKHESRINNHDVQVTEIKSELEDMRKSMTESSKGRPQLR